MGVDRTTDKPALKDPWRIRYVRMSAEWIRGFNLDPEMRELVDQVEAEILGDCPVSESICVREAERNG